MESPMGKDEVYVIRLRDCFTGGYTLPQYCIDNGIKKPLFVSEEKFLQFMWEVYVQFRYDKRLTAQFATVDSPTGKITFAVYSILAPLTYKNISEINPYDFDAIILLTMQEVNLSGKVITFAELMTYFLRKTYAELPLLNFLQRFPQVKLILTNFPSIKRHKGGAEFHKQLKGLERMRVILRADKSGNVKTPLDKFGYTNSEVLELMEAPPVITNPDGSTAMGDDEHPLMMIKDNKRMTADQPEKFLNRIFFVGTCHDFGVNAPFDKTIASHLQKILNENNFPYRVENESQRYFHRYQDIFYNLNKLTPAPGDIIFIPIAGVAIKNFPFLDLRNAFDAPNDFREVYCVRGHVNELGYKLVAEKYFKFLTTNNFFRDADINLPPPQSTATSLRYTAAIRGQRRKEFLRRGA